MNKQEILTAINKTIKGQGSAVDVGGKLAAILESIIDLIPAPAEQVNSDWNATEGPAEILNKPTIPEGPLVVPIDINDAHKVTLLEGAPTKAEIENAARSGRQVLGLKYYTTPGGNLELDSQMLCVVTGLSDAGAFAEFFRISGNTIDMYGELDLY